MNNGEFDKKKLVDAVFESSGGKFDKNTVSGAVSDKNVEPLINKLSTKDKEKLNQILSDKKSMEAALNTPQAKALLKMFLKGGGNNG